MTQITERKEKGCSGNSWGEERQVCQEVATGNDRRVSSVRLENQSNQIKASFKNSGKLISQKKMSKRKITCESHK